MTNIYDVTNLLRSIRVNYQTAYNEAVKKKKKELEILDRDYRSGSPTYAAKKKEIELDCEAAIVIAREKAAKKASEEIEDLKAWELSRVGRIDETALSKINALRGIPVTAEEMKQVLEKNGRSNYWVQKSIASICEENGISVTELPLDSPLDTKLSVLNQLSDQLDKLLNIYGEKFSVGSEAMKSRFLYLNDDILKNAVEIYNNEVQDISEADAATRAYYKIRAMSGQMSKACAISNSLRNLKKQDSKNMLLYQLATDDTVRSEAYEVAGIADVMAEWKGGKAERYAKSIKLTDELKTVQDTEKIKETLRNYVQRVETGAEPYNEFLRHEIAKTYKKNSFIGKALEEMDSTEKKKLLEGAQLMNEVDEVTSVFQNTTEPGNDSVAE